MICEVSEIFRRVSYSIQKWGDERRRLIMAETTRTTRGLSQVRVVNQLNIERYRGLLD
jgi:hypothetical protein